MHTNDNHEYQVCAQLCFRSSPKQCKKIIIIKQNEQKQTKTKEKSQTSLPGFHTLRISIKDLIFKTSKYPAYTKMVIAQKSERTET